MVPPAGTKPGRQSVHVPRVGSDRITHSATSAGSCGTPISVGRYTKSLGTARRTPLGQHSDPDLLERALTELGLRTWTEKTAKSRLSLARQQCQHKRGQCQCNATENSEESIAR